jgi:hypothetical protein
MSDEDKLFALVLALASASHVNPIHGAKQLLAALKKETT